MMSFKVDAENRILVAELSGRVSEADIDAAVDKLAADYPAVGVHLRGGDGTGFRILADWKDLEGWEKGAKTLGTVTLKAVGDTVRKIAVVTDARFADEEPRLADVAPQAEIRFFHPHERDAAVTWLRDD